MATSKTGSFWLTQALQTATATNGLIAGTIDLGAYVDVGDQQAIAVEQCDFIWQRYDTVNDVYDGNLPAGLSSNGVFDAQVSDNNPGGTILRADDQNLIASGTLGLDDTNSIFSMGPDLYPDTFGKLDESRMVVNDSLYIVGDVSPTVAANMQMVLVARIKARIVKLSTKDWIAIAVQSTAADN